MKTIISIVTIASCVFFWSCNMIEKTENDTSDLNIVTETINEYSYAGTLFNEIGTATKSYIINAAEDTRQEATAKSNGNITIEPYNYNEFPKTITVDFGEGTTGSDGIERTGKIIIVLDNGWFNTIGATFTTTFENYTRNEIQVEGTHKIYRAENTGNAPVFDIHVEDGIITRANGTKIYYNQNTTRTHIQGYETPLNLTDDIYEIIGTQSGITSNNYNYTVTTVDDKPIYYGPVEDCPYIRSGVLDLVVDDIDAVIDYGEVSENCEDDQIATIIINNVQHTIHQ